jgi:hypothetical protein
LQTKSLYLLLCVAGTIFPYLQLYPLLREQGLNLEVALEELASNRVGSFFAADVVVSSIVLWVFVLAEGRRTGMKNLWAPIIANLAVGVSLGLPLFLWMRENHLERAR